jgi:hypothetical protein
MPRHKHSALRVAANYLHTYKQALHLFCALQAIAALLRHMSFLAYSLHTESGVEEPLLVPPELPAYWHFGLSGKELLSISLMGLSANYDASLN